MYSTKIPLKETWSLLQVVEVVLSQDSRRSPLSTRSARIASMMDQAVLVVGLYFIDNLY